MAGESHQVQLASGAAPTSIPQSSSSSVASTTIEDTRRTFRRLRRLCIRGGGLRSRSHESTPRPMRIMDDINRSIHTRQLLIEMVSSNEFSNNTGGTQIGDSLALPAATSAASFTGSSAISDQTETLSVPSYSGSFAGFPSTSTTSSSTSSTINYSMTSAPDYVLATVPAPTSTRPNKKPPAATVPGAYAVAPGAPAAELPQHLCSPLPSFVATCGTSAAAAGRGRTSTGSLRTTRSAGNSPSRPTLSIQDRMSSKEFLRWLSSQRRVRGDDTNNNETSTTTENCSDRGREHDDSPPRPGLQDRMSSEELAIWIAEQQESNNDHYLSQHIANIVNNGPTTNRPSLGDQDRMSSKEFLRWLSSSSQLRGQQLGGVV